MKTTQKIISIGLLFAFLLNTCAYDLSFASNLQSGASIDNLSIALKTSRMSGDLGAGQVEWAIKSMLGDQPIRSEEDIRAKLSKGQEEAIGKGFWVRLNKELKRNKPGPGIWFECWILNNKGKDKGNRIATYYVNLIPNGTDVDIKVHTKDEFDKLQGSPNHSLRSGSGQAGVNGQEIGTRASASGTSLRTQVVEDPVKKLEKELKEKGLTPRELEVLRLLLTSQDHVNVQDIADSLYISKRTVDFHIARIYEKLDISSRIRLFIKIGELIKGKRDAGEIKNGVKVREVRLTKREWEVLSLIFEGKTSKEAANILYASKRTVDFHLARIYGRCGLPDRGGRTSLVKAIWGGELVLTGEQPEQKSVERASASGKAAEEPREDSKSPVSVSMWKSDDYRNWIYGSALEILRKRAIDAMMKKRESFSNSSLTVDFRWDETDITAYCAEAAEHIQRISPSNCAVASQIIHKAVNLVRINTELGPKYHEIGYRSGYVPMSLRYRGNSGHYIRKTLCDAIVSYSFSPSLEFLANYKAATKSEPEAGTQSAGQAAESRASASGKKTAFVKTFSELDDAAAKTLAEEVFYKVYGTKRSLYEQPLLNGAAGRTFTVHYDDEYMHDKKPWSKVLQIGPLVFCTIFDGKEKDVWTTQDDIARNVALLGETYLNNAGNIFFYTPSRYGRSSDMPLNPHAQDMIVQMLAEREILKSARKVVILGSGEGLHARIALSLGATQVILIDNDQDALDKAAIYLENDGFKENKDYFLVKADLTDNGAMSNAIQRYNLMKDTDVALINIGSYRNLYGKANERALAWAMGLTPGLIISSGYRRYYSDGGVNHDEEYKLAKKIIEGRGVYDVEEIRNGYPMGELYGELTGTYTLVIKPRKEELGKTSTGLKRGSRASASGETAALAQSRMNKEEYGEAARDLDEIYLMHGPDSQDFKQYAEVIAGEYSRAKFQGVIGAFYAGVLGDLLIDDARVKRLNQISNWLSSLRDKIIGQVEFAGKDWRMDDLVYGINKIWDEVTDKSAAARSITLFAAGVDGDAAVRARNVLGVAEAMAAEIGGLKILRQSQEAWDQELSNDTESVKLRLIMPKFIASLVYRKIWDKKISQIKAWLVNTSRELAKKDQRAENVLEPLAPSHKDPKEEAISIIASSIPSRISTDKTIAEDILKKTDASYDNVDPEILAEFARGYFSNRWVRIWDGMRFVTAYIKDELIFPSDYSEHSTQAYKSSRVGLAEGGEFGDHLDRFLESKGYKQRADKASVNTNAGAAENPKHERASASGMGRAAEIMAKTITTLSDAEPALPSTNMSREKVREFALSHYKYEHRRLARVISAALEELRNFNPYHSEEVLETSTGSHRIVIRSRGASYNLSPGEVQFMDLFIDVNRKLRHSVYIIEYTPDSKKGQFKATVRYEREDIPRARLEGVVKEALEQSKAQGYWSKWEAEARASASGRYSLADQADGALIDRANGYISRLSDIERHLTILAEHKDYSKKAMVALEWLLGDVEGITRLEGATPLLKPYSAEEWAKAKYDIAKLRSKIEFAKNMMEENLPGKDVYNEEKLYLESCLDRVKVPWELLDTSSQWIDGLPEGKLLAELSSSDGPVVIELPQAFRDGTADGPIYYGKDKDSVCFVSITHDHIWLTANPNLHWSRISNSSYNYVCHRDSGLDLHLSYDSQTNKLTIAPKILSKKSANEGIFYFYIQPNSFNRASASGTMTAEQAFDSLAPILRQEGYSYSERENGLITYERFKQQPSGNEAVILDRSRQTISFVSHTYLSGIERKHQPTRIYEFGANKSTINTAEMDVFKYIGSMPLIAIARDNEGRLCGVVTDDFIGRYNEYLKGKGSEAVERIKYSTPIGILYSEKEAQGLQGLTVLAGHIDTTPASANGDAQAWDNDKLWSEYAFAVADRYAQNLSWEAGTAPKVDNLEKIYGLKIANLAYIAADYLRGLMRVKQDNEYIENFGPTDYKAEPGHDFLKGVRPTVGQIKEDLVRPPHADCYIKEIIWMWLVVGEVPIPEDLEARFARASASGAAEEIDRMTLLAGQAGPDIAVGCQLFVPQTLLKPRECTTINNKCDNRFEAITFNGKNIAETIIGKDGDNERKIALLTKETLEKEENKDLLEKLKAAGIRFLITRESDINELKTLGVAAKEPYVVNIFATMLIARSIPLNAEKDTPLYQLLPLQRTSNSNRLRTKEWTGRKAPPRDVVLSICE